MKQNKIYYLLTALCVFSSTSFYSISATAAISDVGIDYEQDTEIVPPINPMNPDETIKSDKNTAGPLSIDYISDWNFSIQRISSKKITYPVKKDVVETSDGQTKEVPNFFQVTDKTGKANGWTLTVKQNNQFQTKDRVELKGAQVIVESPIMQTFDDGDRPNIQGVVHLVPNGDAALMINAQQKQGTGTWLGVFGDEESAAEQIGLTVPGETKKKPGIYSATFTWTLSAGEA
ncbi:MULTISPECIES: WxL domain-containing protein [unclassified Enterococcus]|uniref:WxL domain-containing protein n=1 Tax=unclassified Enterococcus TaxID=2608891 RepID=UPI001CE07628|nr:MULTISPECIES: WxL domain-containing protein [unclassified Enterococcus]MCA5013471.1 WxL domain-containing protein [Enterococcus sp. S23]MCA5016721.1 WxL domain-containing protein [Enterococcus sp. S22(2020)]